MKKILIVLSLVLLPITVLMLAIKQARKFNDILFEIEVPYKKEPVNPILDWINCKLELDALSGNERYFLTLLRQRVLDGSISNYAIYWIKKDYERIEELDCFDPDRRTFFVNWIKNYEKE